MFLFKNRSNKKSTTVPTIDTKKYSMNFDDTTDPYILIAAYGSDGLKKAATMYPNDEKIQSAYKNMQEMDHIFGATTTENAADSKAASKSGSSFEEFANMFRTNDTFVLK